MHGQYQLCDTICVWVCHGGRWLTSFSHLFMCFEWGCFLGACEAFQVECSLCVPDGVFNHCASCVLADHTGVNGGVAASCATPPFRISLHPCGLHLPPSCWCQQLGCFHPGWFYKYPGGGGKSADVTDSPVKQLPGLRCFPWLLQWVGDWFCCFVFHPGLGSVTICWHLQEHTDYTEMKCCLVIWGPPSAMINSLHDSNRNTFSQDSCPCGRVIGKWSHRQSSHPVKCIC